MQPRTLTVSLLFAFVAVLTMPRPATVHAAPLTPSPDKQVRQNTGNDAEERQVIQKCIDLIGERRLTQGTAKGAFRVATNTDAAWIEHYFVLEAMLALLSATDDPKSDYVQWVGEYLTFYAKDAAQQPQGVAHNFDGPKNSPAHISARTEPAAPNKDYDSIDSYAGLFLLVCSRYYKLTHQIPPEVLQAVLVSLRTLNRVINDKEGVATDGGQTWAFPNGASTNGLPIARDNFPYHQLMDAVEAYAGLRESAEMFRSLGQPTAAKQAVVLASGIAKGSVLFNPKPGGENAALYAFRLDNGNQPNFSNDVYPGVLANLFAVSYFPQSDAALRAKAWAMISPKISDNLPEAPSERWLIAARRIASDPVATDKPSEGAASREAATANVALLQRKVTANARRFDSTTYIDRLAITILALKGTGASFPVIERK